MPEWIEVDEEIDEAPAPLPPHTGAGRPRKKVDIEMLEGLCAIDCTNDEIVALLKVSWPTLYRNFEEVIKKGRELRKISVRRDLYRMSKADKVAAAIFLSKNVLGYKDHPIGSEQGAGEIDALSNALMMGKVILDREEEINANLPPEEPAPEEPPTRVN